MSMPLGMTIGAERCSDMAGVLLSRISVMSSPTVIRRSTRDQSTLPGNGVCNASIECRRTIHFLPVRQPDVVAQTAWSQHHSSQTMSAHPMASAKADRAARR